LRPAHVFAKSSDAARPPLLALLHCHCRFGLRLVIVLLSLQGCSASEIGELVGYDPRTVRRWIERYNQEGIAGLKDRPRVGAPRLGGARLQERIVRLLAEPRAWTVGRLWSRLGRPAMSLRTLGRRVREVAQWRRPRLLAKGDPAESSKLEAVRQAISELPEGSVVLAADETHVHLLPWVRSTWILKGRRQEVMTPGQNEKRTIFGALELATGRWFYWLAERANSANFIELLEEVMAGYPSAPQIAIVLDNVSTHTSRLVQCWLSSHPRVKLIYGARYCPHHNPVERIWAALKAYLANSPTRTMVGRMNQVHAFFGWRTNDQFLFTASPFNCPWLPGGYGQNLWEAA
jgi:transposase